MALLELLQTHSSREARLRGESYTTAVSLREGGPRRASAYVHGTERYTASIVAEGDSLTVVCSCPYFSDRRAVCKHLWATALTALERGWLTDLPPGLQLRFGGEDDIDELALDAVLDDDDGSFLPPPRGRGSRGEWVSSSAVPRVAYYTPPPVPKPPRQPEWVTALANLAPPRERDLLVSAGRDTQILYVICAPPGATDLEVAIAIERIDRKKDGGWSKPQPARITLAQVPDLPDPDDRWALALLHAASATSRTYGNLSSGLDWQGVGSSYVRSPLVELLLDRLCRTGRVRFRPRYLGDRASDADVTLRWDDGEPWRFELVVSELDRAQDDAPSGSRTSSNAVERAKADGAYRVDAELVRANERIAVCEFALLTETVAVLGDTVAPFDPADGLPWAERLRDHGPLVIPESGAAILVDALIRSGPAHLQLPSSLRWEERSVAPVFRLTIDAPSERLGGCPLTVEAEYESTRTPLGGDTRLRRFDSATARGVEGSRVQERVVYRRDVHAERDALARLKQLGVVGLSNAERYRYPKPMIHARRVPALVEALVADGWTVEAQGVRYRTLAAPRLRIRSGIDWFELEAVADNDRETPVDIADLLEALASGRRTVLLGDGTVGMLPEKWLARVAPALALAEVDGSRMRFRPSQVALIDALLADQPEIDWDEGYARARRALTGFDGLRPLDPAASFAGSLREYQREALGWMRFLREFGFGGCLADDMGLGKTVMVLAMLDARRSEAGRAHKPSLVVVPRSLLFNWMSEAARFTPELRVLDFAHAARRDAADQIAVADLVLTTYGTLRRDVAILKDHAFDYAILDEAQAIKNAATATAKAVRLLRADHRLALTGTPVENHLGELHSLFDFLNPGILGRGRLLDKAHVRARGKADDAAAQAPNALSREGLERLARGLRPFLLRRTKEQVAPELPARTEETLFCELEGRQRALYDELRDHYRRVLIAAIERQGMAKSQLQALEALLRLRQAACHASLLTAAAGAGSRRVAAPDASGSDRAASAKFDVLLPRLAELIEEGRKALIFSQFTSLLALLRAELDRRAITYEYLDGETRDRAERVARFQNDAACSLFLISLKAGGVGLNLTSAEYVFLLDPWWNPAAEAQAIDRTHRIGQIKPVFAYRLVARNTVEERILELQSRKRELADAILDAGTHGLRALAREDLERLLA